MPTTRRVVDAVLPAVEADEGTEVGNGVGTPARSDVRGNGQVAIKTVENTTQVSRFMDILPDA